MADPRRGWPRSFAESRSSSAALADVLFSRHETPEQIARFEAREITGPDVFRAWDGCLDDSMLSERGNAFAKDYYCFERGPFLADYEELLAGDLPSLYHVADTWKNYDRLRVRLDERFDQWLGGSRWK